MPMQSAIYLLLVFQFTHSIILHWAGYNWNVKNSALTGPGPNIWSSHNVYVDQQQQLHLQIRKRATGWTCAQIWSQNNFGYGTYEWVVEGPIDKLDSNVVLGLFVYPPYNTLGDGTNEIDIEFSQWGKARNPNRLSYIVWPKEGTKKKISKSVPLKLSMNVTTIDLLGDPTALSFRAFWATALNRVTCYARGHYLMDISKLFLACSSAFE